MRTTALVLVATAGLVLGVAPLAQAAKPAYGVTLRAGVTKSTPGHFITVSGKVTGAKAAGHAVTIQRKYVGGAWVTVAYATVSKKGSYSARVETPLGGTTSFRAETASSSVRSKGVSATRSLPVWKWLYLGQQYNFPYVEAENGIDETIGGKDYPRSVDLLADGSIGYKLDKLCTSFTTVAEYHRYSSSGSPTSALATFALYRYTSVDGAPDETPNSLASETPATVTADLTGTKYLYVQLGGAQNDYDLVLGDPKVHCNADSLPAWQDDDIPG
jgi:hypothetical protein